MIPGFSGLPVLYLYFYRGFVLKLNTIKKYDDLNLNLLITSCKSHHSAYV